MTSMNLEFLSLKNLQLLFTTSSSRQHKEFPLELDLIRWKGMDPLMLGSIETVILASASGPFFARLNPKSATVMGSSLSLSSYLALPHKQAIAVGDHLDVGLVARDLAIGLFKQVAHAALIVEVV